jgi:hypothetical protein
MNIPTIGGARGIFEIFVPGMFLLLNLGVVVYLFPYVDDETKKLIANGASNPALILVVMVCFGYLMGVLLRLFRCDRTDNLSAWFLRRYPSHRQSNGKAKPYVTEKFPYIGWIEEVSKQYLSPEALKFYNDIWKPAKRDYQNKQFFTFSKVLINSHDEKAAIEIYATEALTRYISGMFYALLISLALILSTIVLLYFESGEIMTGLLVILIAYFISVLAILGHFRFIRIKEVETVFAASFKNKELFTVDTVNAILDGISENPNGE